MRPFCHLSLKLESVVTDVSWLRFMLESGLEMEERSEERVVDMLVLDLDSEDRDRVGEDRGSGPWSAK